jgi:hypothetical protein
VVAPDQGIQRGPHLGVGCSEPYRQAKMPRVQAVLILSILFQVGGGGWGGNDDEGVLGYFVIIIESAAV